MTRPTIFDGRNALRQREVYRGPKPAAEPNESRARPKIKPVDPLEFTDRPELAVGYVRPESRYHWPEWFAATLVGGSFTLDCRQYKVQPASLAARAKKESRKLGMKVRVSLGSKNAWMLVEIKMVEKEES